MSGPEPEADIQRILPRPSIAVVDGKPHCRQFSDIYHPAQAAAAAGAVFLDGNRLAGRFAGASGCLTVAELGFGLGLNFLATVDLWCAVAPGPARLHYIAVEGFPPERGQIAHAHAVIGSDRKASGWLCDLLPERWPGWHHVDCGRRIALTLIYQDAPAALADADFAADAWFLDGFAPDRNPRMWSRQLLGDVGRLTAPGGSCATYTSAVRVRRNLAAAGFEVFRRPGFAGKREMLCGRKPGRRPKPAVPERVLVVGAGIAGRCVARSLGERGIRARVLASRTRPPASEVPRLLQTPRVSATLAAGSRLSLACFAYAQARALQAGGRQCGALMLAHNQAERARQQRIGRHRWPDSLIEPVTAAEAGERAGVRIGCSGLWIPQATCADSARLLAGLPAAQLPDGLVAGLENTGSGPVAVTAGGERFPADAVVLCCADAAADLVAGLDLKFSRRPGAALKLRRRAGAGAFKIALLYGHVLNPDCRGEGSWLCTSDSGPGDRDAGRDEIDRYLPDFLAGSCRGCPETLWRGMRAALADRLPAAGPAGEGVHLLAGLGSRGHALAFLLAEAVVAQMTGEAVPLPVSLRQAISPARFGREKDGSRPADFAARMKDERRVFSQIPVKEKFPFKSMIFCRFVLEGGKNPGSQSKKSGPDWPDGSVAGAFSQVPGKEKISLQKHGFSILLPERGKRGGSWSRKPSDLGRSQNRPIPVATSAASQIPVKEKFPFKSMIFCRFVLEGGKNPGSQSKKSSGPGGKIFSCLFPGFRILAGDEVLLQGIVDQSGCHGSLFVSRA